MCVADVSGFEPSGSRSHAYAWPACVGRVSLAVCRGRHPKHDECWCFSVPESGSLLNYLGKTHQHFFLTLHSFIVLTTSAGIMDHEEARRKHTGGKILGFFF